MFLSKLQVSHFRCLNDLCVTFQPGLNVILGENNSGKTALIDALRLILNLGSDKRDIFISEEDLWHDGSGASREDSCEIHATFQKLTVLEQGAFSLCLAPSLGQDFAQVHIRCEVSQHKTRRRMRFVTWGGEQEGESLPSEMFDGIKAVYLEALRDAQVGLRPGRGSRISRLVQLLSLNEDEQSGLTEIVQKANVDIESHALIQRAKKAINSRLKGVTGEFMAQQADLRLSPPEFRRITESLRALVGKDQCFEIEENGLGYNNLLYIATVLGELQRAKATDEVDLAVLLIEEPEAHLHPHLQTVLVDYLQDVSNIHKEKPVPGKPQRVPIPVQVFLTSHSPTLASHAELDALNVLYVAPDATIKAFAVAESPLDDREKRDLRRYLDVTKAQLFFGKGVIFVEGISEALLLPELARRLDCDLDKRGVTVVNIQSLSFEPFAKLLNYGSGLCVPAAIITDADPSPGRKESDTATKIRGLAGGTLKVFVATKTFEYDLALAGNAEWLAKEYKKLRPQKGKDMLKVIENAKTKEGKAQQFMDCFDTNDKARFSQHLAQSLSESSHDFIVPGYLAGAIQHVCNITSGSTT